MKPCDLGPLEGPCPRYVVPSSGGKIRFPDYFEDMSDIEDLADYIHSHAAPRQQMARKFMGMVPFSAKNILCNGILYTTCSLYMNSVSQTLNFRILWGLRFYHACTVRLRQNFSYGEGMLQ